jgi:hypothetical protein
MDAVAALPIDCGIIGAACLALGILLATYHRRQAAVKRPCPPGPASDGAAAICPPAPHSGA